MIKAKDTLKMLGVILLTFGASIVSSLFLNYYLDLSSIEVPQSLELQIIYEGQLSMSKITVACAGGVLGLIAVIVLLFSIKRYVDENQANMGILKAMGYSEKALSASFLKFGYPVFAGTFSGYTLGIIIAPMFYSSMNEYEELSAKLTPKLWLPIIMVAGVSIIFSILSYYYARLKLRKSPLDMIKGTQDRRVKRHASLSKRKSLPFIKELRRSMRISHPVLSLFVGIASWGFSAMFQMAFTMMSIAMSDIAPIISSSVGIMMGFVTLIIAADFVLSTNRKYISLMKAYGYSEKECNKSLLGGYRPIAWIGFALGGPYQYYFMKFMVSLFAGAYDVEVKYHFQGFIITLVLFVLCYEGVMMYYGRKVSKVSLKETMLM